MKRLSLILALLLSMLAFASPASAWWNKDWKYRKAVAIDTSPSGINVSGAIGRTVVLVKLTSGNFTFTESLQNGADLRLPSTPTTRRRCRSTSSAFDATTGIAYVWVSVSALNGGEKKQLWLYFGNPNAPVGSDAKGTFDPDYLAGLSFRREAGQPSADSTANANIAQSAPPGIDDGAIIGGAARFPGPGRDHYRGFAFARHAGRRPAHGLGLDQARAGFPASRPFSAAARSSSACRTAISRSRSAARTSRPRRRSSRMNGAMSPSSRTA